MTDWLTPIGILLAGLVAGFMFVYASSRKKVARNDDVDRRDLEAKRDALIAELRADDLSDEEKARIERAAADVLRALDTEAEPPAPSAPRHAPLRPTSSVAGFAWGAGTVAVVALLVWFVSKSSTPKSEAPPASAPQSIAQLEATVKAHPDDHESRLTLAKAYLDQQNLLGVFEQTSAVLAKNPKEPRAQTYQAIVRMAMGQVDQAKSLLDSATATDPTLTDAWVALAWFHAQRSELDAAKVAIESAIKAHPEEEERLRGILAQMQASPKTPASSGPSIHITVNLAAGARANGILFVLARAEGQTSGPPAAVKRVEANEFPIEIDLGAADSMMGQALPEKMRIEARLDADGNAMTKDPSDPKDAKDGIVAGANVTLTLR